MPFIVSRTNATISDEQEHELKTLLGKAIELVPGKSEQALMLVFEPMSHIWLRGDNTTAIAYIEASVWGNEQHGGYELMTAEITRIFCQVLHIPPENVYVRYADIPCWGAAGMTFDRNNYL